MADIRKRNGPKGVTYQARYPSKKTKSGYAYATFQTKKEARLFLNRVLPLQIGGPADPSIRKVGDAIDKWLSICKKEGRDGRDPVTRYTLKTYEYRADLMKAYGWAKDLTDLQPPDIVAFRSWLLSNYSRDQARKVLSSFHSVIKEMALRGHVASNFAAGIAIRADSRYDEPVTVPTLSEVMELLRAADRLANSSNKQTARTWQRYRPLLYLAADTGMRPQEYLVAAQSNLFDGGIKVDRALERGGYKLSVTKTPAGRRFIDLSPEVFDMVRHYADEHAVTNKYDLVFPTANGRWQDTDNWRRRGFYKACLEAGLTREAHVDGKTVLKPKYSPYDLRHFYASLLIERRVNLKRIQKLMGHEDIKTTLNVYGHLIERSESEKEEPVTTISHIAENSCGESVASLL